MFTFFNRVVGERRSAPRHALKIPLRYRVRNSTSEYASQAENVSEMGIFFEAEQPMPIGTIVHVLLDMPQVTSGRESAPWLCTGHVVRLDEKQADPQMVQRRVGVQFDCFEVLSGMHFALASMC
jgi:hypothetical protein